VFDREAIALFGVDVPAGSGAFFQHGELNIGNAPANPHRRR